MPTEEMQVEGKSLSVLVDSGGTHSVIKCANLPDCKCIYSVGASSGVPVRETFSAPVRCSYTDSTLKHSFLISHVCPVNLLGRDLISLLGQHSISSPDGIKVTNLNLALTMTENTDMTPSAPLVETVTT